MPSHGAGANPLPELGENVYGLRANYPKGTPSYDAPPENLFGGGGGGGPMEPITHKDYTDAKVGEVRAEIKADIISVESKILTRLDKMPTLWQLLTAVGGGVLATIAILAYAGDRADSSASRAAEISSSLARIEAGLANQEKSAKDMTVDQPKTGPRAK